MTQEQIALVQGSFGDIAPIAPAAAAEFYARLFALDPTLRPLFHGNLEEQGRKLMAMIGLVVKGLDRLDTLVPAIQNLGRRHASYGVQPAHYATVATALLGTLQHGLGAAWTAEVELAWTTAYTILADTMRGAV